WVGEADSSAASAALGDTLSPCASVRFARRRSARRFMDRFPDPTVWMRRPTTGPADGPAPAKSLAVRLVVFHSAAPGRGRGVTVGQTSRVRTAGPVGRTRAGQP